MTQEAMRFLALNAVLHGHSAVDAFEGSVATMAMCLDISEEEAGGLAYAMQSAPRVDPCVDELTAVFLNFYRNNSYAFVAMGPDVVPLSKFVASDAEGQVPDDLRFMFLTSLVRDVSQDPSYIKPFILDGVLRCTPEAFQGVNRAMLEAYQLYLSGPVGTVKGLASSLRKYTSLEHYSRLNASTLLRIFRQMVRAKHNPVVYQQTMLMTPDLLDTYKHTGCIIAFRDSTHTSVNWLLDVVDEVDSTMVMSVDMAVLKGYLVRDVRDLAGVKVAHGRGESGKILFPGV